MEVILTHENADFDAIASLLAAHKLFPAATPVLPRRINRNGRAFLALYGAELPFVHPDDLQRKKIDHAILVDTQSLTRLKGMTSDLDVDIIDHHERSSDLPEEWDFSGEQIGATTTLLIEAISSRSVKLSNVEATLMLIGIYEDTGSLLFKSTTPRDVRAAAWLMEQGANLSVVEDFIHHPLTQEQRELYEELLENIETYELEGHTIVISGAEAPAFEEEISTLAHKLRDLLEPSALFVLVALNGRIQLVARSTTDDIDVSTIAEHFEGGGHSRAAAALIRERSLEEARAELNRLLPEIVQPRVTVSQIMSLGVQVLDPDETVAEAARRMRRTGHEGYPVVEDGTVIGLLTRRGVDRALQFRMDDAPVTQVMKAGNVTVSSDDSVAHLQELMIESGWGQIPVVEDGEIIGVVTRTDLITLWGTAPQVTEREEVTEMLEDALSPPVLSLVRRISRTADQMGFVPYFVGGLVRDMLLDSPIVDVDMVIEGDAIELARALAADLGGRVIAHRRFGTAKWLLPDRVWREVAGEAEPGELPPSIDFVTARTEFYTHPTALPEVERSSIKQDLHRRDFTINTLAIRLDPNHWGELLDFYGGLEDLEEGVIRVLHSLSFVDDPTRMLRAARLECRLGFRLDPRSEELIVDALPLLKRVSGDRLRHELELIFREEEPERALCRLDELGILKQIQPEIHCDAWLQAKIRYLRKKLEPQVWELTPPDDVDFLHLALLTYRLDETVLGSVKKQLKLPNEEADDLRFLHGLRRELPELEEANQPSEIYQVLQPYSSRVLAAGWIATDDDQVREKVYKYQTTWRTVEPALSGDDLKEMGLEPGPIFGQLLERLRSARLDGEVRSQTEEIDLMKDLIAQQKERGYE